MLDIYSIWRILMLKQRIEPSEIYDAIIEEISRLIQGINIETKNESLLIAQKNTHDELSKMQQIIVNEYDSLKKNTEWNRFTIAFYGETNAGKSTIIESLRILLGEETKREAQDAFLKIQKHHQLQHHRHHHHIKQGYLNKVRQDIMNFEQKRIMLLNRQNEWNEKWIPLIEEMKNDLERLKVQYVIELDARTLKEKDIFLFKTGPLQLEIKDKSLKLEVFYENYIKVKNEIENELIKNDANIVNAHKKMEELKQECNELVELPEPELPKPELTKYSDGKIIGTGESDFTKINTIYKFNYKGTEFNLIDVPGIEGNESVVNESILEAVQKAHAVFYVTRKAAAPQSGTNGVLEKIKKHLGAQTEVWAIFNQSVTNPTRLQKDLINEDEETSLKHMDTVITNQLGVDHYRGHFVISALPSFYAVAKAIIPGSRAASLKSKFLSKYNEEDLLEITLFRTFVNALLENIVRGGKEKIIQSNYNKASVTIQTAIENIVQVQKMQFEVLKSKLVKNAKDSTQKLNNSMLVIENKLEGIKSDVISDFKRNVRNKIYNKIDKNVDNDEVKFYLNIFVEKEQANLQNNLIVQLEKEIDLFQNDIKAILEANKENMEAIIDLQLAITSTDSLNLKMDIDNGLKWDRLLSSLGGLAVGILTGQVIVVISSFVGFLANTWSSFRSCFSSSYKKSQQRKAADQNIREIADDMDKAIEKEIKKIKRDLGIKVDEVNANIVGPVKIVGNIIKSLELATKELTKLNKEMKGVILNG